MEISAEMSVACEKVSAREQRKSFMVMLNIMVTQTHSSSKLNHSNTRIPEYNIVSNFIW